MLDAFEGILYFPSYTVYLISMYLPHHNYTFIAYVYIYIYIMLYYTYISLKKTDKTDKRQKDR